MVIDVAEAYRYARDFFIGKKSSLDNFGLNEYLKLSVGETLGGAGITFASNFSDQPLGVVVGGYFLADGVWRLINTTYNLPGGKHAPMKPGLARPGIVGSIRDIFDI